ncbi:hypothetical protein OCF56_27310 [Bacillus mycoides]|nr:hypothetical protein [Bacillus mycoides]
MRITKHDGTCGGMAIALCGDVAIPIIFLYMDNGVYRWGRYVYTVGLVTAKYTPRF